MKTKIVKAVLLFQCITCFVLALFVYTASFQTGLIGTKAERLSKALQGAQNEFREHSAQAKVSAEIAEWIRFVRRLHPSLIVVLMALAVSGAIGIAGCGPADTSKQTPQAPAARSDFTPDGG